MFVGTGLWWQNRQQQTRVLAESRAKLTLSRALVDAFSDNARAKRDDARSLRARSDERLAVKDYDGAMNARLQILRYDKPKISNLGALTFYATQQLALADIDKIALHLDAATARRYAAQLEKQDAKLFSLTQILTRQKAEELKQIDDISVKGDWQKAMQGLNFSAQERAVLKRTPLAKIKVNIANFYDISIARSKLPYSPARAKPAIALDPYSKNFATAYAASQFLWTQAKAQRLLLVAALMARADRLENATASAPWPLDPFGAGPLHQKGALIYSVGPDAVDDGGVSVPNLKRVQPTDKGDILAPAL